MSPEPKSGFDLGRRATLQAENVSPLKAFLVRLSSPFNLFFIFITILFGAPQIYDALSPEPMRPTQESQLQEVASLLDDIYSTLVNMTFMPATAIKRGPHQINVTAIPCARDSAVLRLMEIMPFVDHAELKASAPAFEVDWFYGGEFIDYRRIDHLQSGCDPYRAKGTWHQVRDTEVQLTDWGWGGWDSDRTHVLLYDTQINAIQVYEGEHTVSLTNEDNPHRGREHYAGPDLYKHSFSQPLAALSTDDFEWDKWFDAPTFLKRILHAYQSLALTPWETSNREDGWGVNGTIIKSLLHENGWRHSFNADHFNADLIRVRHADPGRGPAEAAYQSIKTLTGGITELGFHDPGDIEYTRNSIPRLDETARQTKDEEQHWYWLYRAVSDRWTLERQEMELEEAQKTIERLCPNDECIAPGDKILWDFFHLEKVYEEAQRAMPAQEACNKAPRYDTCIARHNNETRWLHLAYENSKSEALTHCASTGCTLLPQQSLEEKMLSSVGRLHDRLIQHPDQVKRLQKWYDSIPEHLATAREDVRKDIDRHNDAAQSEAESIERLRQLFKEGDREKWQRCMDDQGCPYLGMLFT
ncbi:hypothetical protein DE146DRAFT_11853 [Phaeosphaeria sp. MPI-PUGE-AT-0046c]|nr:hypothetical protein DE146DRAFT_11853 [Phaeosphaeria sp. MPI-PUGE-AT-0046c]